MPEPLPQPNPYSTGPQSIFHSAYKRCLNLESRHDKVSQCGHLEVLICARFLGYMLLEVPTDKGREEFALEVVRCDGDDGLQNLAEVYKNHLLRVFRRNKGHTPTPSHHPSAPSFDAQTTGFAPLLARTPRDHRRAKEQALERDGYRCVFSGKLDNDSIEANLVPEDDSLVTVTELAHIFDRSTNEASYAASALAVLSRFGQVDAIEELNGTSVHRLENVLTLAPDIRKLFDDLQLWLERNPSDPVNHYKLAATRSRLLNGLHDQVILTSRNSAALPPPDPRYLALHAACARVAHLSGAGEYIDRILRDIEKIGGLANDGASDTLYHALVRCLDVEDRSYGKYFV